MPERVGLQPGAGPRVEWEPSALLRSADAADASADPAWELTGDPDWERLDSLRVISGSFGESGLAIVIARPAGAATPDADEVAVAFLGPAGPETTEEVFVSSEYDPDGRLRRIGVELWAEPGHARRIAADRSGDAVVSEAGGTVREATPMEFRLAGERGGGLHELLRPA
jgi:hypothetical protein